MAKVGAPSKLTDEQKAEVYEALIGYIKITADPTMAKFVSSDEIAIQYNVTRDNLNDWPIFSTLIKQATQKQEAFLLEQGGAGKYNPTIAIFRLKQPQHGYKDRFEQDITSNGESIGMSDTQVEQLIRARADRKQDTA